MGLRLLASAIYNITVQKHVNPQVSMTLSEHYINFKGPLFELFRQITKKTVVLNNFTVIS